MILQIVKLQLFFLWTFADVFIITMSIYLTSKFTYFNELIEQKENNVSTIGFILLIRITTNQYLITNDQFYYKITLKYN